MLLTTFDTHSYVKRLVAVGLSERVAEVQADTFKEIIDSQLASKKDIKELEVKIETVKADLKRDIKELELTFKRDLESSKSDTIKWVAGMLIAQAAVITALVKLLSH